MPIKGVSRLQTPALIVWQESFAVMYEISEKTVVLGVPEVGIRRYKPADLLNRSGATDNGQPRSPPASTHKRYP